MMSRRVGRLFLAGCCLLIPLLTGCAAGGVSHPESSVSDAQAVTVSRLDEGRFGFVISRSSPLDTERLHRFNRGLEALEAKSYDDAIDVFRSLAETAPDEYAVQINLAIAYIRSDRDGQAEEPLKMALELVAGHPLASHEYGLLLRRSGRFDEARTVYEESLSRFPEYYPLHRNLGVLCDIYLNDLKCASREFELFLEAQPQDEQVKVWLAEIRSRLER